MAQVRRLATLELTSVTPVTFVTSVTSVTPLLICALCAAHRTHEAAAAAAAAASSARAAAAEAAATLALELLLRLAVTLQPLLLRAATATTNSIAPAGSETPGRYMTVTWLSHDRHMTVT